MRWLWVSFDPLLHLCSIGVVRLCLWRRVKKAERWRWLISCRYLMSQNEARNVVAFVIRWRTEMFMCFWGRRFTVEEEEWGLCLLSIRMKKISLICFHYSLFCVSLILSCAYPRLPLSIFVSVFFGTSLFSPLFLRFLLLLCCCESLLDWFSTGLFWMVRRSFQSVIEVAL